MPATRAIEPVTTVFALRVRQPLLALALWTLPVHLAGGHVFIEEQSALAAELCVSPVVGGLASRVRADKDGLAVLAPVLPLAELFAHRTLVHNQTLACCMRLLTPRYAPGPPP